MVKAAVVAIAALAGIAAYFASSSPSGPAQKVKLMEMPQEKVPADAQTLVVAAGCFWCVEAIFEELAGVYRVESGYAGGRKPGVTYEEVCMGTTGHAEVVKIFFDAKKIAAADLLRLFFTTHDPTTLNRQGPDEGTQYRSAIFYSDAAGKALAEKIKAEVEAEKIWSKPIVTTIEPLTNYTPAEEYHQNYFEKFEQASPEQRASMNVGYCAAIVEPKVRKFRQKYADKLKKRG